MTAWQVSVPRFARTRLLKFEWYVLKLIPLINPETSLLVRLLKLGCTMMATSGPSALTFWTRLSIVMFETLRDEWRCFKHNCMSC